MGGEWKNYKLNQLFDLINGFAFKSADFRESGIPVLKIKNVKANQLIFEDLAYIEEHFLTTRADKIVCQDDLLITMSGNRFGSTQSTWVGKVAWFNKPSTFLINQRVGILRLREELNHNSRFLSYQLSSDFYQNHFVAIATSSGGQANLSPKQILGTELLIPSKTEQDRIANILGSLDDKIELNRRINRTLEETAQAIFRSWFVDFDPVKAKARANELGCDPERAAMAAIAGKLRVPKNPEELTAEDFTAAEAALASLTDEQRAELAETAALFPAALVESELGLIPEGWEVKNVKEVLDINPRRNLKKGTIAAYLDMKNVPIRGHLAESVWPREFNSGTKFLNGDTLLARITPCLENGKTAFVDFLTEQEVGWGSTEFIVLRSINPLPLEFSYYLARTQSFRTHAIQSMTGTSGRQRVNIHALESFLLALPDNVQVLKLFGTTAQSIMRTVRGNGKQNTTLTLLRDTLLPKLLSGEIAVGEATEQVEQSC